MIPLELLQSSSIKSFKGRAGSPRHSSSVVHPGLVWTPRAPSCMLGYLNVYPVKAIINGQKNATG